MLTDAELDKLLNELHLIEPERYREKIEELIEEIRFFDSEGNASDRGYLYGHPKKGTYIVVISSADSDTRQLETFVHITFHVPRLLVGHQMASESSARAREIEKKIDAAAAKFLAQHTELAQQLFESLRCPK